MHHLLDKHNQLDNLCIVYQYYLSIGLLSISLCISLACLDTNSQVGTHDIESDLLQSKC